MSAVFLTLVSLALLFLGYKFYARVISTRIFGVHEIKTVMPSREFEDQINFLPTKKHILFGHHFTSIAGAAPIIGPCVAAYWGWLPAILWVILGTIFMGAVHDFGALVTSVREQGRSQKKIFGEYFLSDKENSY